MTTAPTFAPSTRRDLKSSRLTWSCRFVSIPHAVLMHESYVSLSGTACKLLLAIASGFNGSNNGHLTATLSRMRDLGFNSKDSLARNLSLLLDRGLIVRTCQQHLRSPALYALTWLPIDAAPPGVIYNTGVAPGLEALDLWRGFGAAAGSMAA